MPTHWRALFDELRVEWRDRGPNTSRGNINVKCPWCRDDPGFHLGVAEARDAYYCYRDPNHHSGRNLQSLLIKLGVPRLEVVRVLNRHTTQVIGEQETSPRTSAKVDEHSVARSWNRFVSAAGSREAQSYLYDRGFIDPQALCARFDLRIAAEGSWAHRILIPYYYADQVETWTGRSLREGMQPRYLQHKIAHGTGMIYSPSRLFKQGRRLVLVEGPFDALKLAMAVDEQEYLVVALNGKFLNHSKLLRMTELLGDEPKSGLLALDSDVALNVIFDLTAELARHLKIAYIRQARLPAYANDPADLTLPEIPRWLHAQFSTSA